MPEDKNVGAKQNTDEVGTSKAPVLNTSYAAFLCLQEGDYKKAFKLYDELGSSYQKGFCALLEGDTELARKIWYEAHENSALIWGKCILGLFEGKIETIPSFLQVRNYLESTLYYLFKAKQFKLAQKIIESKDFLADCNIESFKYIARVLMNINEHKTQAKELLEKALKYLPQDYEAAYLLGVLQKESGNISEAKKKFSMVLRMNPAHTPTQEMLNSLLDIQAEVE